MKGKKQGNIHIGSTEKDNGNWKGGIITRSDGYIMKRIGVISRDKKGARYVLLHRIVMEESIGRKLLRSEIVHHKNGNRSDNQISNLKIMTQSEHAKLDYERRAKDKKGRLK